MSQTGPFRLATEEIGPLPIVNHYINRLNIDGILSQHLVTANTRKVEPVRCIGLLLRNLVIERQPMYGLQEWALRYKPELLDITPDMATALNDDRIGRALDMMFDSDRASMQTEIVVRAIKEFKLDLSQMHNDATTITLSGQYQDANGDMKRGKDALNITYGYNKDHRPDLKQLLWYLTVTADGAVPIHYRVSDGNAPESPTHRETWDALRALSRRSDFIYVADCKLCTGDNTDYISSHGGRFITVVPRNRKEDGWFREYLQTNNPDWVEVERSKTDNSIEQKPEIWRMVESPMRSAEGFRIVWVWCSRKLDQDKESRQYLIEKAVFNIDRLETRLRNPKNHLRSRDAVIEEAEIAVGEIARRWVDYEIAEEKQSTFKQEKRGRPSPGTTYIRREKKKFHVNWHSRTDNIAYDARSDGMFPLMTNCEGMPLKDILDKYKFQPRLEKRHEQLKTDYRVAPVFLKNVTRIEGLLFVYFVAMLVQALIEREIRNNMALLKCDSIPIYPEERECEAPTTVRILEIFDKIELHKLRSDESLVQTFRTDLSEKQLGILKLAGVPEEAYSRIS